MSFPSGSIRGFFEVLMPGVFLLLNLLAIACLWFYHRLAPNTEQHISKFLFDPAFSTAILIGFGYLLGVVLRLLKTEQVDRLSAWFISRTRDRRRPKPDYLADRFFYRNWMRNKCSERLPAEALKFYVHFWNFEQSKGGERDTTFFNLCKMVVANRDAASSGEIAKDEAVVRFVAGSFYALAYSLLLVLLSVIGAAYMHRGQTILLALLAAGIVYGWIIWRILSEFRLLRSKEVDTVFNACLVNHKAFEELFPSCKISPENQREQLLFEAWAESQKAGSEKTLTLDSLAAAMRRRSQAAPELSSFYFAGADVDHPYFLKNDALALGISVLPEDNEKAGKPKRHPHQTEVIFILDGALTLHLEGKAPRVLKKHEHFVIERNSCHWITPFEGQRAAFAFAKTNPAEEPRGVECAST